jgi:uncharacterized membrane protein YccC
LSFLTKFFIVLHVVLTMLVVAGLVVFVNRVDEFQATLKTTSAQLAVEQRGRASAEAEANAARADAKAVQQQALAQVNAVRGQLNAAQTGVRERDTRIATSEQNLSSANARLQAATAALKTAQETVKTLEDQLNQTRTASDKIQQQNTELLTANSDLNARLQTALRQYKNATEELDAAKQELANAQDQGGKPATQAGNAVAGAGPTPSQNPDVTINGIIRDQKTVNGVNYATISVGSKDNVTKGMVFNVIERGANGDWLGYITIDRVEQSEASGRLEGPHVDRMKPGNEVRTQL